MFDFELAASYLFQKKNDQALAVLKQAYESAPQYDQAAQAYAVALMITGDEADARKIPSVDPKILDTVKSYADTNQFYKAFVFFQGVILTSQDANVEFEQVDAEYNEGLTAEAIQTLQSIESIHPEMRGSVEELIKKISSRGETS
jgi:tetratricopeptide (TPR) repeat protein